MKIEKVIVGELETNCYILSKNEKSLIIDPGDEFDKIKNAINTKVAGVLLTHRHYDHIGALDDCLKFFDTNVYYINNLVEGKNKIDEFEFEVRYNPGHTLDSISFIFDDIMFSGDFIFEGCIGRWDVGGNQELMIKSIKDILKENKNYKIYPGHGEPTTLDGERENLKRYI